jgi:NAD(P)-dependent dehydrogenase (short-subunit alcohol dehydrogenase family)
VSLPLAGQVAIVTGASRGIGRAVALAIGEAGSDLVLAGRSLPDLEKVASEVTALGRKALPVVCDVRDPAAVEALAEKALERFGRIDTLVNNAGLGHFGPVESLPVEQFDEMLAVNLRGPFLCTRAVVPAMKRQGTGAIVNVASVAGLVGNPNLSGYNASKFGLMGFSEATMLELRHAGIKVAVICPGSVATDFGHGPNVAGMLAAEDVAAATMAILLAAPNALLSQIHLRPLRPPKR